MRAYFILIILFVFGCKSKKEKLFLENILQDGARNGYYILTKVDDGKNKRICIINNYDLFGYFYSKGVPEEQYESKAFEILTEDRIIRINTLLSDSRIFIPLDEQKLNTFMAKGESQIISQYFKGQFIKDGVSFEDQYHIIGALFSLQVATRHEDETGFLTYNINVRNF